MTENDIHVVQFHPPINWPLLNNDLMSKRTTHQTLGRYVLELSNPLLSWNYRTIDSLSRVFSRIISNEFQSNIFSKKYGFFVSGRSNENICKVDVCTSSRQIYQRMVDVWLMSDRKLESAVNITRSDIKKGPNRDVEQKLSSLPNASLTNILRNIIKNCGDVNKSITIWSILPENNSEFKSTFNSIGDDTFCIRAIEWLLNICFNDLQREFFNIRNVKINIVLIMEYPKTFLSLNNNVRPIIVTNQSNNQFKISFLDSRCLLSYSDVIIANSLNLLTLRLDFSNLFCSPSAVLTFFIEKSNYILKYIENDTNNTGNAGQDFDSADLSDSEEGEVIEQENIIVIMEDEFLKKGWAKLVGNVSMKVLGIIPPHWSPTALKLFPVTSPVGRNSSKLLKDIYHSLNYGSFLLGKNDIPLGALVINISKMEDYDYVKAISKNTLDEQSNEIKTSCRDTEFRNGMRNLFNIVIIRRKPIIPVPISRKFHCELKINSMVRTNASQLNNKYILFATGKFQELFNKVKTAIDLNIYIKQYLFNNCNLSHFKKIMDHPENALLEKLDFTKDTSNSIKTTLIALPSLLTDLDQFIAQQLGNQTYTYNSKSNIFDDEKKHFELKFNLTKSKLLDLVFPIINRIERKTVLQCFLNSELFDKSKPNKTQNLKQVVSRIDSYISILLGEFPMSGCLFCSNGVATNEKIPLIIAEREFVMQSVPKLFWLAIQYIVDSMKFVSKEHQRIFNIISNGIDAELPVCLTFPIYRE